MSKDEDKDKEVGRLLREVEREGCELYEEELKVRLEATPPGEDLRDEIPRRVMVLGADGELRPIAPGDLEGVSRQHMAWMQGLIVHRTDELRRVEDLLRRSAGLLHLANGALIKAVGVSEDKPGGGVTVHLRPDAPPEAVPVMEEVDKLLKELKAWGGGGRG